jgi:hypothetical protein
MQAWIVKKGKGKERKAERGHIFVGARFFALSLFCPSFWRLRAKRKAY